MLYIIENSNEFRENVRKQFEQKLNSAVCCANSLHFANNIEISIYNRTLNEAIEKHIPRLWNKPPFVSLYLNQLKNIYFNFTPDLVQKIITREIDSRKVGFMTHQELKPDLWNELIEIKRKRDDNKYNPKLEASTNLFTCRCGSKKCTYYEMQIRSADEPATCFITCLECDRKWKK
jgi:DNA-directed RNA polymerase subunit M/transcription elongation factor TFIIS